MQYQAWLCPQAPLVRDTGIRVGQGGFHTVCELIGQSGWYAFERINNDKSVSHWFINQDGQHNNYIFPMMNSEFWGSFIYTPFLEDTSPMPSACGGAGTWIKIFYLIFAY